MNKIVEHALTELLHRAEQFGSEIMKYFREALLSLSSMEGTNGVPVGYTESIFTNHLQGSAGSEFVCPSADGLIHMLFGDYGKFWEEFTPPEDSKFLGCRYFRVNIPDVGLLGAAHTSKMLKIMNPKTFVQVALNHAGNFEIQLQHEKMPTDTVTLITEKIDGKDVISTIYPGAPTPRGDIKPKDLKDNELKIQEGDYIPLLAAAQMGFVTVKFI